MPKYDGILIRQRKDKAALQFFAFGATAREILSWSAIQRTADVKGAAQRIKNEAHIRTIRGFVSAAPKNIIPTAVTLAIRANAYQLSVAKGTDRKRVCRATLDVKVPSKAGSEKPAIVIDGQHRLLAMEPLDEQPPLLACAILGADALERALHFIVINNKPKRVPSDLVRAIMAELTDAQRKSLQTRLTKVGMTLGNYTTALEVLYLSKESPFHGLLDWDINRKGAEYRLIKPLALESALRTILADLRAPVELDVDDAVELLCAMWRGVRDSWSVKTISWNDPTSKLIQKASLVAVTEFLVTRLNMQAEEGFDVTDVDEVEKFCASVMSSVPSQFWLIKWTQQELDTSAGRGLIRQSLSAIRTASAAGSAEPLQDAALVSSTER